MENVIRLKGKIHEVTKSLFIVQHGQDHLSKSCHPFPIPCLQIQKARLTA